MSEATSFAKLSTVKAHKHLSGTHRFDVMPDIYLLIEGQQQGPYTQEQIRQSLADGSIPTELPAWDGNGTEWVPVETLIGSAERDVAEEPELKPPFETKNPTQEAKSPLTDAVDLARSPSKAGRTTSIRFIAFGLIVGGVVIFGWIGAKQILLKKSSGSTEAVVPHSTFATDADTAEKNTKASTEGSSSSSRASDIEEARAFIEKQLGRNFYYTTNKKRPSVRIETDTGHMYINYIGVEGADCLLGSLDADAVVVKSYNTTHVVVIPAKDYKKIIQYKRGEAVELKEQIELPLVPEDERVAEAFRFLITSYAATTSRDDLNTNDLRSKLCKELRSAMLSDNTIHECQVSYDKSTETLRFRLTVVGGPYIETVLPMKKIDPQAMKWQPSGRNRSKLSFPTIDDEAAIQVHSKFVGQGNESSKTFIGISFPTEYAASDCAETVMKLCTELGWKPSKF